MVGFVSRHSLFFKTLTMEPKTLSIFVDESGNFSFPDSDSRFYIVSMVFHDQSVDITPEIIRLEQSDTEVGLEGHCFHAGPLIRREKNYSMLSRQLRGRIFSRMMAFARKVDYKYHCLSVDKKFITSTDQIVSKLQSALNDFIFSHRELFNSLECVKIYYDCGQAPVTRMLHQVFETGISCSVEFTQDVKPSRYRLFQVADLICTIRLIEARLADGGTLTRSENRFFGGVRDFQRNILKRIKRKEI